MVSGLRAGERVVLAPPPGLEDGAGGRGSRDEVSDARVTVLVEIRGVTKVYQRGSERIEVLHGVDLDIPRATSWR